MITVEQIKKALNSSHDECATNPTGCIHADAVKAVLDDLEPHLVVGMMQGLKTANPAIPLFFIGLHVGYRLHQIVAADEAVVTPKEKVN